MSNKKRLIILDLDHTLVYASFAESETAPLLFQYSEYLKVYVRPYAKELAQKCKGLGDVMVYTTAKFDYAQRICEALQITPIELVSRETKHVANAMSEKKLKISWKRKYKEITIIDDSPEVWDLQDRNLATFIVPPEFMGNVTDNALKELLCEI